MVKQGEFLITLMDEERNLHVTRCKTNKELATFLMHLDEARFMVANIAVMEPLTEDYSDFLITNTLESGDNNG